MSLARDAFYRQSKFTAWREERDANGIDTAYALIGTFSCTWTNKSATKINEAGREFTPAISIFAKTSDIIRGDVVSIGEFVGSEPPESARKVMKVEYEPALVGTPDYNIHAN
ncbi:MAG: hypothetical protein ACPH3C_06190 [Glaciecola sp.]